jgi:predicted nucleotidyltransferase
MCEKSTLYYITQSVRDAAQHMFADNLDKVILFGSYTRDDYDSESDIDIMILLDIPAESINKYFDEIVKLSSRLSLESEDCVTVSIIMQDRDTFSKYEKVLPFFRNISNEGVIIYAT